MSELHEPNDPNALHLSLGKSVPIEYQGALRRSPKLLGVLRASA